MPKALGPSVAELEATVPNGSIFDFFIPRIGLALSTSPRSSCSSSSSSDRSSRPRRRLTVGDPVEL